MGENHRGFDEPTRKQRQRRQRRAKKASAGHGTGV